MEQAKMVPAGGEYPAVAVVGQQFCAPYPVNLTIVRNLIQNDVSYMMLLIFSLRSQWEVYRGDSSDPKDLLFTVKKSSILQLKTQLDVFLANNNNVDFRIKGSWLGKACTICAGNSSKIIAQMYENRSVSSILLGKDEFAVTVYPSVDYAFIVVVVLILEETNKTKIEIKTEAPNSPG